MSFVREALRDKPLFLAMMDDASPFQDHSGNNAVATVSGTPGKHFALAAGAAYATILGGLTTAEFDSPVFKQSYEKQHFSLEATVLPIVRSEADPVSDQQILGHLNEYDGLGIRGTIVYFRTKYSTGAVVTAEYDLQVLQAFTVVGTHTESRNSLYINGELVAETIIPESLRSTQYVATNGKLYSGATTSTRLIAINGVGIYGSALPAQSIKRHFQHARDVVSSEGVAAIFKGNRVPVSRNHLDIFLDQTWTTEFDWRSAVLNSVVVAENRLRPQLDSTGLSLHGEWLDSFALDASNLTSIYGVNMLWDGEGAIIEVSLDGTTWETIERGKNISMIPPGFDPTNKELQIKISFPGGIQGDPSYVDNLNVIGFKTGVSTVDMGRTVTYTAPAYVLKDSEPIKARNDWGVDLAGGTVTVSADNSTEANLPKTIEVWMKKKTPTDPTLSANLTGATTTYVNGEVGSTHDAGEWIVKHFINSAGFSGDVTIGGNVQVGHVTLYKDVLSATQIGEVYKSYTGKPVLNVGDNSLVSVAQAPIAASIYAHDWAITGAG